MTPFLPCPGWVRPSCARSGARCRPENVGDRERALGSLEMPFFTIGLAQTVLVPYSYTAVVPRGSFPDRAEARSVVVQDQGAVMSGALAQLGANFVFDEATMAWMIDARCLDADPEAFFPEKGGSTREAKRICAICPVVNDCLEHALGNDERFGIWGGRSERERRRLRRLGQ